MCNLPLHKMSDRAPGRIALTYMNKLEARQLSSSACQPEMRETSTLIVGVVALCIAFDGVVIMIKFRITESGREFISLRQRMNAFRLTPPAHSTLKVRYCQRF